MSGWFLAFLTCVATTTCEECDNTLIQKSSFGLQTPKVATYVQIGTPDSKIWEDLYTCISNVAKSQAHGVDVFLSAVVDHQTSNMYLRNLSAVDGVSKVTVQEMENQGADIGQFLRQISTHDVGKYVAVLKVHTKANSGWRQYMIQNLCGTPDAAKAAVQLFEQDMKVGILGPREFTYLGRDATYAYDSPFCQIISKELCEWFPRAEPQTFFPDVDVDAMRRTWNVMMNSTDLPPDNLWAIISGSFFWFRGVCFNKPWLLRAIPALVKSMSQHYEQSSSGKPEHAMERWIPTLVRLDGWKIADVTIAGGKSNIQILG